MKSDVEHRFDSEAANILSVRPHEGERIIVVQDVGPRDGLQSEPTMLPTKTKVALIDALAACGFPSIEATSFTAPGSIPALADAEAVMRQITRRPGVVFAALVPNVRGAERALRAGSDELNYVMSVSAAHGRANLNMTTDESFAKLQEVTREAIAAAVPVRVSLSTAFGCPFDGYRVVQDVSTWVRRLADTGVDRITLCDTTGMAYPNQVYGLVTTCRVARPSVDFALHFHDTRGLALANTVAGLQAGVRRFDASIAGLGGCPYAPGATGNVATEDLVHMLQLMGFDTGIDLAALLAVARLVGTWLGRDLGGHVLHAGAAA